MMKNKKANKIDYVAPQVIDLGFPESLYGQATCTLPGSGAGGEGCLPGNDAGGETSCDSGSYAQFSCHFTGQSAGDTCEQGYSAGNNCNRYGQDAVRRCNPTGNIPNPPG